MLIEPSTDPVRDLKSFFDAKRVKREPIKWNARGVVTAKVLLKDRESFNGLREALRRSSDFGQASEHVDRIEHELQQRRQCRYPLPVEVWQHPDRSLSLGFGGITIRAMPDGVAFSIGGTDGHMGVFKKRDDVKSELIEALALKAFSHSNG